MINPVKDHHYVCLYDKRLMRFFYPNVINFFIDQHFYFLLHTYNL